MTGPVTDWTDGPVRVLLGEALERLRELPDASVDALVTDPPYALRFMGQAWDAPGKEIDASFANWLAGFTDGEGCFRIHRGKGGDYYACHFQIKMRRDDRPILQKIRRLTGVGRVFDADYRSPDRDSCPQAVYLVQDRAGCVVIRDLFMRFPLRAKKLREFEEWSRALDDWLAQERGNRWHGPGDKSAMERRWLRMKRLREYQDAPWSGHSFQDWTREWAEEALRVLKPGGHGLVFGGTRTYGRLASGLEDAGFEIRDVITWHYGSGFPKSYNLAGDWVGWGTALKPGTEMIAVIRKPLSERSVAANVLEHGTGALNIDGCRIHTPGSEAKPYTVTRLKPGATLNATGGNWRPEEEGVEFHGETRAGRWPANLVLSHAEDCVAVGTRRVRPGNGSGRASERSGGIGGGMFGDGAPDLIGGAHVGPDGTEEVAEWRCAEGCPVAELDRQSGITHSSAVDRRKTSHDLGRLNDDGWRPSGHDEVGYGDRGGASRYFYVAKASARERSAGLPPGQRNVHPTVKPIELMRYLCRLVTPPGGLILDPFMGSGTTGVAAILEGFGFVGIEQDPESVRTAIARLQHWRHEPELLEAR